MLSRQQEIRSPAAAEQTCSLRQTVRSAPKEMTSYSYELRYLYRTQLFNAGSCGDAGQTRHGPCTRIGKLQVFGKKRVLEYRVLQPFISTRMATLDVRHFDAFAL